MSGILINTLSTVYKQIYIYLFFYFVLIILYVIASQTGHVFVKISQSKNLK